MKRLSQGHLNLLSECPRKFRYIFLDRLQVPASPEQQERLDWGNRLHQLMQQQELGLPALSLAKAADDASLATALEGLTAAVGAIAPSAWRAAERAFTLEFAGVLLTAICDLAIVEPSRARILDWKTYPRPLSAERLAADWQTRLYLYILAETLAIAPESLSMTYWFVRPPTAPQSVTLPYDCERHGATHQDLQAIVSQFQGWLAAYCDPERREAAFPQLPAPDARCQSCQFASRCHDKTNNAPDRAAALAATPEIEIC